MGALFRKPQAPEPQKVPDPIAPPPTIVDNTVVQAREESDNRRRRRGRAASILTGAQGAGTPTTAATTLGGT